MRHAHTRRPAQAAERERLEGNQRFGRGDWPGASACYERAAEAAGAAAIAHLAHANRSLCLLKMGRHSDALQAAEQAVAHKPEWPKGWARKAASLEALGRAADALLAAQRALTLEQSNAEYRALALSLRDKVAQEDAAQRTPSEPVARTPADQGGAGLCAFLRHDPPEGRGDNLLVRALVWSVCRLACGRSFFLFACMRTCPVKHLLLRVSVWVWVWVWVGWCAHGPRQRQLERQAGGWGGGQKDIRQLSRSYARARTYHTHIRTHTNTPSTNTPKHTRTHTRTYTRRFCCTGWGTQQRNTRHSAGHCSCLQRQWSLFRARGPSGVPTP